MEIIETTLKDAFIIKPNIIEDSRGYFYEVFRKNFFEKESSFCFVQENESQSKKGTFRGLHFQKEPFSQAKLIRVLEGEGMDIIIDLRISSPTFGKSYQVILSKENKLQIFVPRGFAHGFIALKDDTIMNYKLDNYYNKESEGGLLYSDKHLNIEYPINNDDLLLSERDKLLPDFENCYKFE